MADLGWDRYQRSEEIANIGKYGDSEDWPGLSNGNHSHVMKYQTSAELACRMYEGDYIDKYGISSRWLCDWLNCFAAMGIAGMGRCPGNPFIVDCPEFMTEPEFAKWCEV